MENHDKLGKSIGFEISKYVSLKMGQDQESKGVSVPCLHATPVANALRKPLPIW